MNRTVPFASALSLQPSAFSLFVSAMPPSSSAQPLVPTSEHKLQQFLRLGIEQGCPKDQLLNFSNAGIILQDKQLAACAAARLCDKPNGPKAVGYGGARGGGKTHWLLSQMGADDCQR